MMCSRLWFLIVLSSLIVFACKDGDTNGKGDASDEQATETSVPEDTETTFDTSTQAHVDSEEDTALIDSESDGGVATDESDGGDADPTDGDDSDSNDGVDTDSFQTDSDPTTDDGPCIDEDSDDWCRKFDCEDTDSAINPDATENPDDGVDNDCDGQTDENDTADLSHPELWYAVEAFLVHIPIDRNTAVVDDFVTSPVTGLATGHNCLTMLEDGSLFGARLSQADSLTYFYHIPTPPRDGSPVVPTQLGIMGDSIMLEGLYTDCDGRLYGMDTGADVGSATGNRLLRFTGDYLAGDFSYQVISDLSDADVADIDDLGPGVGANGKITDNPGFAIDSGNIYDFNYETGNGTQMANGGTWGIHALGGDLFADGISRVYLLSSDAALLEFDPVTKAVSDVLKTGPATENGFAGWSGLAGPLTDCDSSFVN